MRVTRRSLLASLGATAGALALDPERALWVSGARVVSIPAHVHVPRVHVFGVDIASGGPCVLPAPPGMTSFGWADFTFRAEEAISRMVDAELARVGKSRSGAVFLLPDLPVGVDLTLRGRLGAIPIARMCNAYCVRSASWIARMDVLVRI